MKKNKSFYTLQSLAKKIPFSEGAKFMNDLKGLRFSYYDAKLGKWTQVDRWELWTSGYKNTAKLKHNLIPNVKIS